MKGDGPPSAWSAIQELPSSAIAPDHESSRLGPSRSR